MSIDEARLDEIEEQMANTIEVKELIRLARIGIWAKAHGVPAFRLMATSTQFIEGEYGYQFIFLAKEALSKLPSEGGKSG